MLVVVNGNKILANCHQRLLIQSLWAKIGLHYTKRGINLFLYRLKSASVSRHLGFKGWMIDFF